MKKLLLLICFFVTLISNNYFKAEDNCFLNESVKKIIVSIFEVSTKSIVDFCVILKDSFKTIAEVKDVFLIDQNSSFNDNFTELLNYTYKGLAITSLSILILTYIYINLKFEYRSNYCPQKLYHRLYNSNIGKKDYYLCPSFSNGVYTGCLCKNIKKKNLYHFISPNNYKRCSKRNSHSCIVNKRKWLFFSELRSSGNRFGLSRFKLFLRIFFKIEYQLLALFLFRVIINTFLYI